MKNTVYTIEEYMTQGFTKEEAFLAQEHDILFNKYVEYETTEKEKERMFEIAEILGF